MVVAATMAMGAAWLRNATSALAIPGSIVAVAVTVLSDLYLPAPVVRRNTATHDEKRTSWFDALRDNCLRENPRLSDDGIRGNRPLRYDDASDAGVGAKSEPDSDIR